MTADKLPCTDPDPRIREVVDALPPMTEEQLHAVATILGPYGRNSG
jgi:hypothetical protein